MSSWLSDLAGRAEALLNQVDQAAATSLQDAGLTSPSPKKPPPTGDHTEHPSSDTGLVYEPIAHPPSPVSKHSKSFTYSPMVTTPPRPTKPQPVTPAAKHSQLSTWGSSSTWSSPSSFTTSTPTLPTGHSQHSSSQSTVAHKSVAHSDSSGRVSSAPPSTTRDSSAIDNDPLPPAYTKQHSHTEQVDSGDGSSETKTQDNSSVPVLHSEAFSPALLDVDLTADSTAHPRPVQEDQETKPALQEVIQVKEEDANVLQLKVTNFEQENNLLRQEVQSLSEELSSVLQRNEKSREHEAMLREEIVSLRQQASHTDQLLRQMRSEVEDLTTALQARDSQNQVLRSQLQHTDRQLEEMKQGAEESVRERERLLQDASRSSGAQNQALSTIKSQLLLAEDALKHEREALATLQAELTDRENQFESERQQLSAALHSQQREYQQQQLRHNDVHTALMTARKELQAMRREHEDYKQRATGILQAKEKLITSLQSAGDGEGVGVKEAAIEEMRVERQHLVEQLQSSHQLVNELRSELQEVEDNHSANLEQLVEQLKEKEEFLTEERENHSITQEELQQFKKELDSVKNEYVREKALLSSQIRNYESELTALKSKFSSMSLHANSSGAEERLHDLTESLIHKQTLLEQLNAEKHSLQLQLDKTETALASAEKLLSSRQLPLHTALNIGDEGHVRPMTSILPTNTTSHRYMRRVRTALNAADKFSAQIGAALQRYPYVRLFALLYMILLHVWVMVILFTYKPEAHSTEL